MEYKFLNQINFPDDLRKFKIDELFSDFNGSIKSLGAWGGDFILATGNQKPLMKNIRSFLMNWIKLFLKSIE